MLLKLAKKKNISNDFFTSNKVIFGETPINKIFEIKWLRFNSSKFKTNIIFLKNEILFEIFKILLINDKYYFFCKQLEAVQVDTFLNSVAAIDIGNAADRHWEPAIACWILETTPQAM